MNDESESRVLVTGGAGAIGSAIARHLVATGASVAVADLDAGAAQVTARQVADVAVQKSQVVTGLAGDVTDEDSVRQMVDESADRLGGLNIVVNNAGAWHGSPLTEQSIDDWDRVHHVNLRGAFLVSQAAARHVTAAHWGRIVNISSAASLGRAERVAYSSAKMGIHGLTRALALELGPDGCTVNAVAPGTVPSAMSADVAAYAQQSAQRYNESAAARTPVRRTGTPEDIAEAVGFLAARRSGFITGQVLFVDGGANL